MTRRVSAQELSSVDCIALGLKLLAAELQRAGKPIPPVLDELVTAFTVALRGQERTPSDTAAPGSRPAHDELSDRHWLTPPQAAQVVGVSTRTIRRWIESGALTPARRGRVIRIHRTDLTQFMTTSKETTAA